MLQNRPMLLLFDGPHRPYEGSQHIRDHLVLRVLRPHRPYEGSQLPVVPDATGFHRVLIAPMRGRNPVSPDSTAVSPTSSSPL